MSARPCKTTPCPCGSGQPLAACCGRYHNGEQWPDTAVGLMRSRYSAYVLGDEAYLLASWHPDTRPAALNLAAEPPVKWLGLSVLDQQAGQSGDSHGTVSFVARYKVNGRALRLTETSHFVREAGRWCYLEGEVTA